MDLKKRLGKRIQELRVDRGLKQAELAELVGIATKTQSCVETGRNFPSADLLERYAKVFKVDVEEVLNITHIKETVVMLSEINILLQKAPEHKIVSVYKFLRSI